MMFSTRALRARDGEPSLNKQSSAETPNGTAHSQQDPVAHSQSNSAPSATNKSAMMFSLMMELHQSMQAMRSEFGDLRGEFHNMATQQDVQQKVFDTLHTELSDYKNDFVSARMKPMLTTILFLHDAIDSFKVELEDYADAPDWLGDKVVNKGLVSMNLEHFQDHLSEVLKMCELEPIQPEVGTLADPKTQNVIAAEPTDDPALDKHIQRVVRTGFTQREKTFRPAEVIIWKLRS